MNNTAKQKKIGSFTLGISLIAVGVAFLLVDFDSTDSMKLLFSLWPLVLIVLGAETVITQKNHPEYTFSLSSIFIIILLILFAFCMAGAEMMFSYAVRYGIYNMF